MLWVNRKYRKWILLMAAVIFLVMGFADLIDVVKPAHDINYMNAHEIRNGMHVKTEIYCAIDWYAYENTTETQYGITVSEKEDQFRYYLIPVFEDDTDDIYYMSIKVPQKDYPEYEQMVEETWAYMNGETDEVCSFTMPKNCKVKKLDAEMQGFFYEWYTSMGYDGKPSDYLVPYYLQEIHPETVGIMLLIGFLMLLGWAVWFFIPIILANSRNKNAVGTSYSTPDSIYGGSTTVEPYSTPVPSPSDRVNIMGYDFLKTDLDSVDYYMRAGRREEAYERLMSCNNMDESYANLILNQWNQYYHED